jgi:hypothetical protein
MIYILAFVLTLAIYLTAKAYQAFNLYEGPVWRTEGILTLRLVWQWWRVARALPAIGISRSYKAYKSGRVYKRWRKTRVGQAWGVLRSGMPAKPVAPKKHQPADIIKLATEVYLAAVAGNIVNTDGDRIIVWNGGLEPGLEFDAKQLKFVNSTGRKLLREAQVRKAYRTDGQPPDPEWFGELSATKPKGNTA